jgi:hypothetical protein
VQSPWSIKNPNGDDPNEEERDTLGFCTSSRCGNSIR